MDDGINLGFHDAFSESEDPQWSSDILFDGLFVKKPVILEDDSDGFSVILPVCFCISGDVFIPIVDGSARRGKFSDQ